MGGSYGSGDSAYRVTFRAEAPQRYVLAWDRVADPAVRSDGEHPGRSELHSLFDGLWGLYLPFIHPFA